MKQGLWVGGGPVPQPICHSGHGHEMEASARTEGLATPVEVPSQLGGPQPLSPISWGHPGTVGFWGWVGTRPQSIPKAGRCILILCPRGVGCKI